MLSGAIYPLIRHSRCVWLNAAVFLLLTGSGFCDTAPRSFRVSVRVGGDLALAPRIELYLHSAMRALGDVQITDRAPEFGLEVISAISDKSHVVAFSIITSRHEPDSGVTQGLARYIFRRTLQPWNTEFLKNPVYAAIAQSLVTTTTLPLVQIDHRIRLFERAALYEECSQVVDVFDRDILTPLRANFSSAEATEPATPLHTPDNSQPKTGRRPHATLQRTERKHTN